MKKLFSVLAVLWLTGLVGFGQPVVPSTSYTRGLLRSPDAATARAVLEVADSIGGVTSNGVFSGTQYITNTPWGNYTDHFYLNSKVGPTMGDFFGDVFGHNLTLQGGDIGFLLANKVASVYNLSFGNDWVGANGVEPNRLRLYQAQDVSAGNSANDVAGGFNGIATSLYAPLVGGNASTMQGLPPHGGEIAQRQPTAVLILETSGSQSGGARPVTNNCTQNWVTNNLAKGWASGWYSNIVNAGGQIEVDLAVGWAAEFRNPDGSQRWNTNMFPDGPVWLANCVHTNGMGASLTLQVYYSGTWSNATTAGLVINDGGGYLSPVMTMDRATKDIGLFSDWGMDGILASDQGTQIESPQYRHAMNRQIWDEVLNPRGLTIRNQATGPARPMHVNTFVDMRGYPDPSTAYEVTLMRDGNWPGSGPVTSPVAGANAMQGARWTWNNNMAAWAGKGHYTSEVQLPLGRTWNTNTAYNVTRADGQFWMAMGAMYPSFFWQIDGWDDSSLTNSATTNVLMNASALALFFDSAYAPAFPVYDAGTNNLSIWLKPLAGGVDYALVFANETGSSSNMTFNWATNLASPARFHAVNCPLYPVRVPTNAVYVFSDVFNGTNSGPLAGSFTVTVTNHSCLEFKVTRKAGGGDGLISFAADATYAMNATGCTNTLGKNATAFVTATAVAFTIKDSASTTLYTSPTLTTTIAVHLQPGWSVNAASGLAGTVVRE